MNKGMIIIGSTFVGLVIGLTIVSHNNDNYDALANTNRDTPCPLDIECLDSKHHRYAEMGCKKSIEEDLRANYRWTNLGFESILENKRFNKRKDNIIVYTGGALEVQNNYGEWIKHTYTCFYDTKNITIKDYGIFIGDSLK
jgi:hypothetical protein